MLRSAATGRNRRAARSKITSVRSDPQATTATQSTAVRAPLARGSTLLSIVAMSREPAIGPMKMAKRRERLSPARRCHWLSEWPPPNLRRLNCNVPPLAGPTWRQRSSSMGAARQRAFIRCVTSA